MTVFGVKCLEEAWCGSPKYPLQGLKDCERAVKLLGVIYHSPALFKE